MMLNLNQSFGHSDHEKGLRRETIEVEAITRREDVPLVRGRWESLALWCGCTAPYLSHEWYSTALETVDREKDPLLVFFKQGGEDVGLAPLVHSRGQGALRFLHKIGFVSNPFTPYQGVLHAGDFKSVFAQLMRFLEQRFGSRFVLDLDEMRPALHETQGLDELSMQEGLFLCRMKQKSGSRYLLLRKTFEENYQALAKHTQKEFKRKINRISRLGKISLLRVSGREQIDCHLGCFFDMYARTWKGAEPHPEFYYLLCRRFDDRGGLRFHALTLNDRPIAYLISILSGDTVYGIKTTYNPSYYAYSPGVLLFYKVIEDMFNTPGIREFDIGRGDEQFKREWTSSTHEQVRVLCYPRNLMWKSVTSLQYELLPRWRQNERFDACYSSLRRLLAKNRREAGPAAPGPSEQRQAVKEYEYAQCRQDSCPVTARLAGPGDLDLMTVAMEARNFAEIQQRLDQELCVLCFEGRKLLSFFWLRPDGGRQKGNGVPSYAVSEWGLRGGSTPLPPQDVLISSLLALIKDIINKPNCTVSIDESVCRSFELFE
ncbi:MAG TPA: GNAT family N-acetyltransferase [Deltaproteobacteria bacterium]|nr:GNAT family N-acetyltransferase [Deltaproteobacteria bacterium]